MRQLSRPFVLTLFGVVVLAPVLLTEKPFELRTELVAAGQVFVVGKQRTVLLSGSEGVVLMLQRGHHLCHFSAALNLLVDLRLYFGARSVQCLKRNLQ